MASKLQMVTEFSYHKTLELSSVRGNWQRYLKTAARIYKYPFRDQLLIHAQRPDATACATIEFWNKKMDRWVNKGTSGIALLGRLLCGCRGRHSVQQGPVYHR